MNMYSRFFVVGIVISVFSLSSCNSGPDSPSGFSLPKGDALKGMQVLLKHQCLSCHILANVEDNGIQRELEKPIKLGGDTAKVMTYADLVTSIINPSHKISRGHLAVVVDESGNSIMRNYNDVMTVTELIDLVSYLQPQYTIKHYEYSPYRNYYVH